MVEGEAEHEQLRLGVDRGAPDPGIPRRPADVRVLADELEVGERGGADERRVIRAPDEAGGVDVAALPGVVAVSEGDEVVERRGQPCGASAVAAGEHLGAADRREELREVVARERVEPHEPAEEGRGFGA